MVPDNTIRLRLILYIQSLNRITVRRRIQIVTNTNGTVLYDKIMKQFLIVNTKCRNMYKNNIMIYTHDPLLKTYVITFLPLISGF